MSVITILNNSPSLEQEEMKKEGIVAILGDEKRRNEGSIRRTLSADMSSKTWFNENGFFSSVKRNPYSYGFDSSTSSESEEEWEKRPSAEDVWKDIVKKEKPEKTENCSSMVLITQKSEGSVLPAPYIHPLVKRSSKYMSEKSLQMCTEPLGSETGAGTGDDCCLSSYSCSRGGGGGRERVAARKHSVLNKKSPAPPPLSSVSGKDGSAMCIQSRRENGRLVIEAVTQPPRNRFIRDRREGRLVLSLTRVSSTPAMVEEEEDDESVEEEKRSSFVVSDNLNTLLSSGIHKLVMKRLSTVGNKNPKETDNNTLSISSITKSPPPMAALLITQPPSFNTYEYFWRSKTNGAGTPTTQKRSKNNNHAIKTNENQKLDLVASKGNREDYFVSYLKGCKETRKPILFWEVDCIPTS